MIILQDKYKSFKLFGDIYKNKITYKLWIKYGKEYDNTEVIHSKPLIMLLFEYRILYKTRMKELYFRRCCNWLIGV